MKAVEETPTAQTQKSGGGQKPELLPTAGLEAVCVSE
jgi:hypothetical protein